jgi:hypothetical protein
LTFSPLRVGLRGVRAHAVEVKLNVPTSILSWTSLCSRVLPEPDGLLARLPLLGFLSPSAHRAMGSDLHRVCLTRLRGVFELSRPLDASFLPKPCRFCFTPTALLGFCPSEVSPPDPPVSPLGVPSPHDVVVDGWLCSLPSESARIAVSPRSSRHKDEIHSGSLLVERTHLQGV